MDKTDHANYLVSLSILIDSCGRNGQQVPLTLSSEYAKHWDLFKDSIKNEKDDDDRPKQTIPRKV